MTKTITPQDALVHFQALWPWASNLHKGRSVGEVVLRGENPGDVTRLYSQAIDWPEGVDRWPPPEPDWRDAVMPQDWGKDARFRDDLDDDWFEEGLTLGGFARDNEVLPYVDSDGNGWAYCQVRVEPEPTGKDLQVEDGWQTMDSAPKDSALISLRMGGQRVEGYWSMCGIWVSKGTEKPLSWDKANQPTGWRPLS
jgi:hypothetical protein